MNSSQIATIFYVENIVGRPQYTLDIDIDEERAERVKNSSVLDDKSVQELVDWIMPRYDRATNGLLKIQEEPDKDDHDQKGLDHICHKLHNLRFKDSKKDFDLV